MTRTDGPVVVVAVGGFDPGGGAGVVRDLLTARARGARARLVPTAWTAQSSTGVAGIEPREAGALGRAVSAAIGARGGDGRSPGARAAVKVGMLVDAQLAAVVARALGAFRGPVVVDPVLAASSGGALYDGDATALPAIFAGSTLMTPNASEAAILTGLPVRTPEDAARAGQALVGQGVRAVLVKGGHLDGPAAVDVLVDADGVQQFSAARVTGPPVRGTGCALATAIAVELASGRSLRDAIAIAKAWLADAIARAVDVDGERHLS